MQSISSKFCSVLNENSDRHAVYLKGAPTAAAIRRLTSQFPGIFPELCRYFLGGRSEIPARLAAAANQEARS